MAAGDDLPSCLDVTLKGCGALAHLEPRVISIDEWLRPDDFAVAVGRLFNLPAGTELNFFKILDSGDGAPQLVGITTQAVVGSVHKWLDSVPRQDKVLAFTDKRVGVDIVGGKPIDASSKQRLHNGSSSGVKEGEAAPSSPTDKHKGRHEGQPWHVTCDMHIINLHARYVNVGQPWFCSAGWTALAAVLLIAPVPVQGYKPGWAEGLLHTGQPESACVNGQECIVGGGPQQAGYPKHGAEGASGAAASRSPAFGAGQDPKVRSLL